MHDHASNSALDLRIAAVRGFNRFYTNRLGLMRDGYLQSRFSLTEVRVLYEIAHNDGISAARIGEALGLDAGYLSRMLRRFEQGGLLARDPSPADKRRSHLKLTPDGRAAFVPLEDRSRQEIGAMLCALPEPAQEAVVDGMRTIAGLLSWDAAPAWTIRSPRPGDIGWVIGRHGALYAQEYGFNHKFEVLVAKVAAEFLDTFDATRERAWIAEREGVRLGSVFVVRKTDEIAKLRLLLVEPSARGTGLGKRLVEECITFARAAGYSRMTLWTNDILTAARGIYRAAGFQLISTEPHSDFGPPMVGEEWELSLCPR